MGTWGAGNLDNDYALDELGDRAAKLLEELLLRAQRDASRESDEYDYTTLFVELELLFALDAADLMRTPFPSADAVRTLAANYIVDWDVHIDALGPKPEHKQQRRAVILASFERLAGICEKHEGDRPLPAPPPPPPAKKTKPKRR